MKIITLDSYADNYSFLLGEVDSPVEILNYQPNDIIQPDIVDELISKIGTDTSLTLFDNANLNINALEIYSKLRLSGIRFSSLIAKSARIAASVKLGENLVIGHDVTIDEACVLKSCITIGDFSLIKQQCSIGNAVTIGVRAVIERAVKIGSHVNLPNAVYVKKNIVIGNNVEISEHAATIDADVRTGTFTHKIFPNNYYFVS